MQSQDYCLQEYALQEQDLHSICCKGMTIQPPSAALPGSSSVTVRQEMDVFENLKKSVFGPLA